MPSSVRVRLAGALLVALSCAVRAQVPAVRPDLFCETPGVMEFSGRLIVRPLQPGAMRAAGVAEGAIAARHTAAAARLRGVTVRRIAATDESIITVPAGHDENSYARLLMATGDYEYAHPDWICFPVGEPDDPYYPYQWHHANMQSALAWDITTGDPSLVCAFVDTGIDLDHPDLAEHRVSGYNSPERLAEADGGNVADINGHGTWVSGTAAAIGNNTTGVAGVGWNFRIMMVRTTNSGDGSAAISDILDGVALGGGARGERGERQLLGVGAGSIGTTGTYIKSLGALFCYAAGNDGRDLDGFDYPDVVVCGASNPSDGRPGWSAYGRGVDVFAPGEGIWSTSNGGGYDAVSGTSFATPMTNGVIAMIWSINRAFPPDAVLDLLYHSCDDLGPPGEDLEWGWGRVNTFKAVTMAQEALTPQPPVAADDAGEVAEGEKVGIDPLKNDRDPNFEPIMIARFDAASAAGGSVDITDGTGPDGRDEFVYSAPPGFSGEDTFTYAISDPGGLESTAAVRVNVVPLSEFRDPENPELTYPGLDAAFYEVIGADVLPDFTALAPYAKGKVSKLAYSSTDGAFAGSGRADDVGAVFSGYFIAPVTGYYTLYTESDDGSALFIGGERVVDNDGLHGMVERGGRIGLKAGSHAVHVEFFERGGGAGLIVRLESSQIDKDIAANDFWLRPACPADMNLDEALNINDFIAFQAFFREHRPRADFNKDGLFNINDFIAYQVAFRRGCGF